MLRHITVKFMKTKNKENIFKAVTEKQYLIYLEKTLWMKVGFSKEAMESRRKE